MQYSMPVSIKDEGVKFTLTFKSKKKTFAFRASRNPLPSLTLTKFFFIVGIAYDVGERLDILGFQDGEGRWREICRGQSNESHDFWKLVSGWKSSEPVNVLLHCDCQWIPHSQDALRVWAADMRNKGLSWKELDKFHPGLEERLVKSLGEEEVERRRWRLDLEKQAIDVGIAAEKQRERTRRKAAKEELASQ